MAKNKVVIELVAKDDASRQFLGSVKKMEGGLDSLKQKGTSSLGGMSGLLGKLKGSWIGAGAAVTAGAAAVTGAVYALQDMYKEVTANIDSVGKYADRIGISVEALSAFHFAAQRSGVEVRAFDMGLQRMVRRVSEASHGFGEAKDAIIELGLNAKELATLPIEDQFLKIAGAMSKLESQYDKVRLAQKLFDSEGVALLQLLNQGEEGIQALTERAAELGVVFDELAFKRAAAAQDAMLDLESATFGLKTEIAIGLAPTLTELVQTMTDTAVWIRENKERVKAWTEFIVRSTIPGMNELIGLWKIYRGLTKDDRPIQGPAEAPPGYKDGDGKATRPPREIAAEEAARKKREAEYKKRIDQETKLYQELLGVNDLSEKQLDELWSSYRAKRSEQIRLEARAMEELGISADLITETVKKRVSEMDQELAELKEKMGVGLTPEKQAEIDVPLLGEGLKVAETAEDWLATWEQYKAAREVQIEAEIKKLEKLGASEEAINAKRKAAAAGLSEIYEEQSDKILSTEIELLEELLNSDKLSKEERLSLYEDYHAKRVEQIEKEADAWRALGVDSSVVNDVIQQRTREIGEDLKGSTDEWGQVFDNFQTSLSSSLEAGFFDLFKSGIDDLEDVWTQFLDMLLESWMRTVSQMAVNQLLYGGSPGSGGGLMGSLTSLFSSSPSTGGGGTSTTVPPSSGGVWVQEGGLVQTPTKAIIGEVPEVVIPLHKAAAFLKKAGGGGGGGNIINFTIQTPDVQGFKNSQSQILSTAAVALRRSQRNL